MSGPVRDGGRRPRCRLVSLDEVYELSLRLAEQIEAAMPPPEIVVAIARGGFPPARFICDRLDIRDLACIQVSHYLEAASPEAAARIQHPLCAAVEGRRVLVVDDVNDTGETLRVARDYVSELAPARLHTAVLHEKTRSPVRADFSGATLAEWRWLIYPWAVFEDVGGFLDAMTPRPGDPEQAAARLKQDYDLDVPPALLQRLWERLQDSMSVDVHTR